MESGLGVREEAETRQRPSADSRRACLTAIGEDSGFLGLNGTSPETSGFAHSCSLPQVVEIVKKLESRQRGWEEDEDPERKGAIVFNATSEFCRTLGEIPTYGLAGNREEQEELMVGPCGACLSPPLPAPPLLPSALGSGPPCQSGPGQVLRNSNKPWCSSGLGWLGGWGSLG